MLFARKNTENMFKSGKTLSVAFSASTIKTSNIFLPKCSKASLEDISRLQQFVDCHSNIFVLTGAGLSTESGVPDYRSKNVGLYDRLNHKPMQHRDFISSNRNRTKYWARNFAGYDANAKIAPNIAHYKLKELEAKGKLSLHLTQNVDNLSTEAGIQNIVELHGAMRRVICLHCETISLRSDLQAEFKVLNQNWSPKIIEYLPDSDTQISDKDLIDFKVPPCKKCGGILKPDVIFFGDNVPRPLVDYVFMKLDESDAMLVVGSSLHVWSGFRFVQHAFRQGLPIAIINVGPTRGDDLCMLKINSLCSDVLSQIDLK